jgi:large subunit ribosomal protein L24e
MTNCTFCGAAIEPGTGKMYIKRDGTVHHFDSAKCQRNMVGLGRVNRHVKWTQAAANAKTIAGHAAKAEPKAKAVPKAKAAKASKAEAAAPKAK